MRLRRVLIYLAATTSVLVLVLVLTTWFMTRDCRGNSEAANSLRELSRERLSAVFDYVKALDMSRTNDRPITMSFPRDQVPKEIADLNPKFLQVSGDMSRIHISGCFDDKVYLSFLRTRVSFGQENYCSCTRRGSAHRDLVGAVEAPPNYSFKPRPLRGSAHALSCSTPPCRKAVRLNSGVRPYME